MSLAVLTPRPPSDSVLVRDLRRGDTNALRSLYRRHYAAVHAYAVSCTPAPLDAAELTGLAFTLLVQRLQAGEPFTQSRHPGCLRGQLQDSVRTAAVARTQRDPASLSPAFRAWVREGAVWPLKEDGQLTAAFALLHTLSQCLLWHTVVERDDAATIARITGLDQRRLDEYAARVRDTLRQVRTDLYLQRLELPDCQEAIRALAASPRTSPAGPGIPGPAENESPRATYSEPRRRGVSATACGPGIVITPNTAIWTPTTTHSTVRRPRDTLFPMPSPPLFSDFRARFGSAWRTGKAHAITGLNVVAD
ncbi:hypothetical protein [Streptomyces sp. BPTC-684]|uniref:RNA polymerase sigma factor n=1 Tax=Streptomyces sp. BPTC-684 TaxID=3043734 RepID=UPI0024B24F15|nr:hypothetical protein [Streptomyces sp. BPTC-684]WHM40533.1 hypothetical protein QIY60_29145 [Streptomyces sp. BPTC-684]